MLNFINLNSALVVAPISMAKIEGTQSVKNTLSLFTQVLLPYAPDDGGSTDVAVVTTEGLYMNDAGQSAYALRNKLWEKADRFRRQFQDGIVRAQKEQPRILPEAYEVETFDTIRAKAHRDFRQLLGFLKDQATTNEGYRSKLTDDLSAMGQPEREDKIAFLHEEFVWGWLLYSGCISMRENGSLRRHRNGQTIICYPGSLMTSQIEAYRLMARATGGIKQGTCIYVNTALNQDEDISLTISGMDAREPSRNRVPQIKLLSGHVIQ